MLQKEVRGKKVQTMMMMMMLMTSYRRVRKVGEVIAQLSLWSKAQINHSLH